MPINAQAFDRIAAAALKATKAPGAAIAVVAGGEEFARGYGQRSLDADDPVTADTLFAIASTTKAFTTAGMALLVSEGKMRWDDPVRKHLPEFRLQDALADANVTMRDLVCHRTGLPRHDMLWFRAPWGRTEFLRRIGYAKLTEGFRAKYQYQNICFTAAGEAVARTAGFPNFEAFAHARLFEPLGMAGANFTNEETLGREYATPHRSVKKQVRAIEWVHHDVGGAGGIRASARDLVPWLRFQLSGGLGPDGSRLVDEAALRETHTPHVVVPPDEETRLVFPDTVQQTYGLGWTVFDYRGGHRVVTHGGTLNGFRSVVTLVPDRGIGIAVVSNVYSHAVEIIRCEVLDLLLGLPKRDWTKVYAQRVRTAEANAAKRKREKREKRHKGTRPSLPLSAFAGAYEDPAYGTATVSYAPEAGLSIAWSSFDCRLKHWHHDRFVTDTDDVDFQEVELQFALGADGEPASLRMFDTDFVRARERAVA